MKLIVLENYPVICYLLSNLPVSNSNEKIHKDYHFMIMLIIMNCIHCYHCCVLHPEAVEFQGSSDLKTYSPVLNVPLLVEAIPLDHPHFLNRFLNISRLIGILIGLILTKT